MSSKPITETERKSHFHVFRGGPLVIWTPRLEDENEARYAAARLLHNNLGPEVPPDDDMLHVDLPTQCLLQRVCRDPKNPSGFPFFASVTAMAATTSREEKIELLDLLNSAIASERGEQRGPYRSPGAQGADDFDEIAPALASCETAADAMRLLAGWDVSRIITIAWQAARLSASAMELIEDVQDYGHGDDGA